MCITFSGINILVDFSLIFPLCNRNWFSLGPMSQPLLVGDLATWLSSESIYKGIPHPHLKKKKKRMLFPTLFHWNVDRLRSRRRIQVMATLQRWWSQSLKEPKPWSERCDTRSGQLDSSVTGCDWLNNMLPPPKIPISYLPRICDRLHYVAKGLCRCGEVKALERGRLHWIIQVGPMQPQGSSKRDTGGRHSEKVMWPWERRQKIREAMLPA